MKNSKVLFALVIFVMSSCIISGSASSLPRIAVLGVDSTAPGYDWRMDSVLSYNAAELMINSLVNDGRFEVYERSRLDAILEEVGFQHGSGLVDPATAVQIGKLAGVDIVISGRVSNVQFSKGGSVSIAGVQVSKSSTRVSMTVRAIDVTTGRILFSSLEDEKSSRTGISGKLYHPMTGAIGFSTEEGENILGAISKICEKVVEKFGCTLFQEARAKETARKQELEGYVVEVMATSNKQLIRVYTNLGQDTGIKIGDMIEICQEGNLIRDPLTNEILDRELHVIALARITSVKEKVSIALVEQMYGVVEIVKTDIVRLMP